MSELQTPSRYKYPQTAVGAGDGRVCDLSDCASPLIRRAKEDVGDFVQRKYCSRSCARRAEKWRYAVTIAPYATGVWPPVSYHGHDIETRDYGSLATVIRDEDPRQSGIGNTGGICVGAPLAGV